MQSQMNQLARKVLLPTLTGILVYKLLDSEKENQEKAVPFTVQPGLGPALNTDGTLNILNQVPDWYFAKLSEPLV